MRMMVIIIMNVVTRTMNMKTVIIYILMTLITTTRTVILVRAYG